MEALGEAEALPTLPLEGVNYLTTRPKARASKGENLPSTRDLHRVSVHCGAATNGGFPNHCLDTQVGPLAR